MQNGPDFGSQSKIGHMHGFRIPIVFMSPVSPVFHTISNNEYEPQLENQIKRWVWRGLSLKGKVLASKTYTEREHPFHINQQIAEDRLRHARGPVPTSSLLHL